MRSIFLWFYSLPVSTSLFLILMSTVIFLCLRSKFGNTQGWREGILLLFIAWIAIVLYITLGYRTKINYLPKPVWVPFRSYYVALHDGSRELYRANYMNVLLFYPAGLLGCDLLPKHWRRVWKAVLITSFLALLSICIEYAQYRLFLGLAETDDVIHNILGALLGGLACWIPVDPIMTLFKWR